MISRFRFTIGTCRVTVKRCEHHQKCKSCWTPIYVNEYKKRRLNLEIRLIAIKLLEIKFNCIRNYNDTRNDWFM